MEPEEKPAPRPKKQAAPPVDPIAVLAAARALAKLTVDNASLVKEEEKKKFHYAVQYAMTVSPELKDDEKAQKTSRMLASHCADILEACIQISQAVRRNPMADPSGDATRNIRIVHDWAKAAAKSKPPLIPGSQKRATNHKVSYLGDLLKQIDPDRTGMRKATTQYGGATSFVGASFEAAWQKELDKFGDEPGPDGGDKPR